MNIRYLISHPIDDKKFQTNILDTKKIHGLKSIYDLTFGQLKNLLAKEINLDDAKKIRFLIEGIAPNDSDKVYKFMLDKDIRSLHYILSDENPEKDDVVDKRITKIKVSLKLLTGQTCSSFEIPVNATIGDVKKKLYDEHYPGILIQLIIDRRIYRDSTPIGKLLTIPKQQGGLDHVDVFHVKTGAKLIVLDVEGTIITGYQDDAQPSKNGKLPAIIDTDLAPLLKELHEAGFNIVLNTGTSAENLDYYMDEFEKVGISQYIYREEDELAQTFYVATQPKSTDAKDGKVSKLKKYCDQFGISEGFFESNVYFYDDGPSNVKEADAARFKKSYVVSNVVSEKNSLCDQLRQLLKSVKKDNPLPSDQPVSAVEPLFVNGKLPGMLKLFIDEHKEYKRDTSHFLFTFGIHNKELSNRRNIIADELIKKIEALLLNQHSLSLEPDPMKALVGLNELEKDVQQEIYNTIQANNTLSVQYKKGEGTGRLDVLLNKTLDSINDFRNPGKKTGVKKKQ